MTTKHVFPRNKNPKSVSIFLFLCTVCCHVILGGPFMWCASFITQHKIISASLKNRKFWIRFLEGAAVFPCCQLLKWNTRLHSDRLNKIPLVPLDHPRSMAEHVDTVTNGYPWPLTSQLSPCWHFTGLLVGKVGYGFNFKVFCETCLWCPPCLAGWRRNCLRNPADASDRVRCRR